MTDRYSGSSTARRGASQPYLARIKDALKAQLIPSAPPGVAEDLATADRQYRAMKTIQPLAAMSATGDIRPGGLMRQVVNQSNKFDSSNGGVAYTGGGELGKLGQIGQQFFGTVPESGTAARIQAFNFAQHPVATTVAAIPGVALNAPLQWALCRPAVARNLANTALGGPIPDTGRVLPLGLLGAIDRGRQ